MTIVCRMQPVISKSSGEAEFYQVSTGGSEGLYWKRVLCFVGFEMPMRIFCDSSAARGIAQRLGVGKVRHLAVTTLWIQECVHNKEFSVLAIHTSKNPEDILTKCVPRNVLTKMLGLIGMFDARCLMTDHSNFSVAKMLLNVDQIEKPSRRSMRRK